MTYTKFAFLLTLRYPCPPAIVLWALTVCCRFKVKACVKLGNSGKYEYRHNQNCSLISKAALVSLAAERYLGSLVLYAMRCSVCGRQVIKDCSMDKHTCEIVFLEVILR